MRRAFWVLVCLLLSVGAVSAQGRLGQVRKAVKPPPPHEQDDEEEKNERKLKKTPAGPGLLNRVRAAVRPPSRPAPSKPHRDRLRDRPRLPRGGPSFAVGVTVPVESDVILVPEQQFVEVAGGQETLLIEPLPMLYDFLPDYPYQPPYEGYVVARPKPLPPEDADQLSRWGGRFSIENGNDFDGLNRFNFHLLLQTGFGIGLQHRTDFLTEDRGRRRSDSLTLSTTELLLFVLTDEQFQTFVGLGFRAFDDRCCVEYGFNFTWGIDVFPVQPFVVSFVLDAGNVGSADVFHVRTTFGVMLRRFEVFAGYDYRSIGGVDVQGLLAGVRLWF